MLLLAFSYIYPLIHLYEQSGIGHAVHTYFGNMLEMSFRYTVIIPTSIILHSHRATCNEDPSSVA